MQMMMRFGAVLLVGLAACGGRGSPIGPGEPPDDPPTVPSTAGRYPLYLADGRQLPAVFLDVTIVAPNGEFRLELTATSGFLDLKLDGTYTQQVVKTGKVDGVTAPIGNWNDHGTWTVAPDGKVTLTSNFIEGQQLQGTVTGVLLRIDQDLSGEDAGPFPVRFVYRK